MHINQQEVGQYLPNIWHESCELRVQDDNWAGDLYGMVMGNTDTSAGQVSDALCRYTSLDGGDLNGDGYDDMVVGHISKGARRFDTDPDLLETGIRVFQWDPTLYHGPAYPLGNYYNRYGDASDMTLTNGRIVDVKIIDLDDAIVVLDPTTCTEVWSMGYGLQTDLDQSCKVDWGDFSVFASTWLDCNDPTNMPPCIANW